MRSLGDAYRLWRLRRRTGVILRRALGDARTVALVNYPDFGNVGDPALWLGTMHTLHRLGVSPSVHVGIGDLNGRTIDRLRSVDVILLNGGGNFGDLWTGQQQTREQVLEACRDRRIVQLSQSCWFEREENLQRMIDLIARARNLTLMWRDRRSLEFAQEAFAGEHLLAPDMAFGLAPVSRRSSIEVVCLLRADQESKHPSFEWGGSQAVKVTDWTTDELADHPEIPSTREQIREMLSKDMPGGRVEPLMLDLARWRVDRGFEILGAGRAIVTDRLHGHVMALLLRRPHVILDNSYGKVVDLHTTWTEGFDNVEVGVDAAQAIETARRLVSSTV